MILIFSQTHLYTGSRATTIKKLDVATYFRYFEILSILSVFKVMRYRFRTLSNKTKKSAQYS